MPFDKALHPTCDTEGPFGVPMSDAVAKHIESLLKQHEVKDDALTKLAGATEVEIDSDRTEISKITTEAVDRDREVVIAKGIDLASFKENPALLLNHNWYSPPIGKVLWVKNFSGESRGLKARSLYAKRPEEASGEWVPDSILSLIKQGMLPGKSIGFIPLERRTVEKSDLSINPAWKEARSIISKCVLLELSVVSIPSNAEALCESVMKSFPGLAALMPELAKKKDSGEATPPAVSLDQLLAELAALKAAQPQLEPLLGRILALEEERDGLRKAIRRLRKDLIREPRKAKEAAPQPDLQSQIAAAFRKMIHAA